eukprot:7369041-Prymnesium_polylepis.1
MGREAVARACLVLRCGTLRHQSLHVCAAATCGATPRELHCRPRAARSPSSACRTAPCTAGPSAPAGAARRGPTHRRRPSR